MRTAALLPTPGDPFVVSYWLRNYERVWRGEVDELHVLVNGQTDRDASAFVLVAIEALPEARARWTIHRLGHGEALRGLVDDCGADIVVLMEDDAYVRKPGAVRRALERVADNPDSVVGSPRGGMSPEVGEAALARFGPVIGPDGSEGHGLWPAFLFARRLDLAIASAVAGLESRSWAPGEPVPGIDVAFDREVTTDTLTAAAFVLRSRCRVFLAPQHKELWQKDLSLSSDPPWFHAGGLSNADLLAGVPDHAPRDVGGTNEGLDWAHRCWWWRRAVDSAGDRAPDLAARYRASFDELVARAGIAEQLASWDAALPPWISWDDRA